MLSFANDYSIGAHPDVLKRIAETNHECTAGYCDDEHCVLAADRIRSACHDPTAQVYFITGGTVANKTVIDSMLRSEEGVIAAESGHINTHEAGAIESSGHRILPIKQRNGKISSSDLVHYLRSFHSDPNRFQMVYPGMVFISLPTEMGTLYSKEELADILGVCREYGLLLYIDGARLGYGLASPLSDLSLPDIARSCDVFYIGGTKNGALLGEAVVFPSGKAPAHFSTIMKRQGGLLAKGRLLGVQFEALFSDDLYSRIAKRGVEQAFRISQVLQKHGIRLWMPVETNQVFAILADSYADRLAKCVIYRYWLRYDETHIVARFVTTWAVSDDDIRNLDIILGLLG